jgi:hypothetical protein
MPTKLQASSTGKKRGFIDGYTDDARMAGLNSVCPPAQNMFVLKTGEIVSRGGQSDTEWDLNEALKKAESLHIKKYNVTFFSLNGKVKYIEHDRGNAVVDTGLSLTATETTKLREFAGDVYCTNKTDGLRQIHVFRLNDAAPELGDATFVIDQDGAGRLLAFGDTSGNIRIRGTNEQYASLVANGTVTLTGTLSATYANNDIAITVEDISTGRPKGTDLTFWHNSIGGRMIVWGVVEDTNTYGAAETIDSATNSVYFSKFCILSQLENIISFDVDSTADIIMVGTGGEVTQVIATRNYIYYFTRSNAYYSAITDVDPTSGAMSLQELSQNYGCYPNCAADLGNGRIAFLTYDNRIIAIDISTEEGAPVVFPNEDFDIPYQNTLYNLDRDQTGFFFFSPAERMLFCHLDIDGERVILPFDNTIRAWQPPIRGWSHSSMFVKDGITYATYSNDDTIVRVNDGIQDNGFEYESIFASPILEGEDGRTLMEWTNLGVSGRVTENATVYVEHIVSEGEPQVKELDLSQIAFTLESGLGTAKLGSRVLSGFTPSAMGEYDKNLAIAQTWGTTYQLVMSSVSPFTVRSYTVNPDTYLTLE